MQLGCWNFVEVRLSKNFKKCMEDNAKAFCAFKSDIVLESQVACPIIAKLHNEGLLQCLWHGMDSLLAETCLRVGCWQRIEH